MASYRKQIRTHLKNEKRHCNALTGNKEVLLKMVRVCSNIALFNMLQSIGKIRLC